MAAGSLAPFGGNNPPRAVESSVFIPWLNRYSVACRLPCSRSRAATLTSPVSRYCRRAKTPQRANSVHTNTQESKARRWFLEAIIEQDHSLPLPTVTPSWLPTPEKAVYGTTIICERVKLHCCA